MTDQTVHTPNVIEPARPISYERNLLRVVQGGGITLFGKMFTNASRFVMAFLLARLLGASQYGMYQVALNMSTLAVSVAMIGLDTAMLRYIAISVSRKDEKMLWGTLQIGIGLSALLSVIAGTALFALSHYVANEVFHEPKLAPLLQIVSIATPFITLGDVLAGATRGFKNMSYAVIAQFIAQPMVKVILVAILAIFGLKVWQAVAIYAIGDIVSTLLLIYYLNKLFTLRRPLDEAERDLKGILGYAFPDWVARMLDQFQASIQALMIGSLNTLAGVGIFAVSSQLNILGHDFYSSINIAAKPLIAELHDQGDKVHLQRIYQTATKWSLIVNLPFFLAFILFPTKILAIFGQSFESGALALMIVALANLIDVATGMCGTLLNMTGYTKLKLANTIFSLTLATILNMILIPHWGLVGAAITTLTVITSLNVIRLLQVYFLLKIFPYNAEFIKPIIAATVSYLLIWALNHFFPLEDIRIRYALVQIVALFGVFAAMIWLMGLSEEDRNLLDRVWKKTTNFLARNK